ncbi:hypothetical protein [Mycoplasma struthionis]|uniref:Uncharacterized protein n=1 Tax=Mycoplasma struthionis TaxID=538220 RepID=A0A3G8LI77_9MOLU|nr:hypothetical protein [Mycoplasma struthionis]AZG68580.1 hypothetical protein EGN60_01165 [Mycoplasma struthionis]
MSINFYPSLGPKVYLILLVTIMENDKKYDAIPYYIAIPLKNLNKVQEELSNNRKEMIKEVKESKESEILDFFNKNPVYERTIIDFFGGVKHLSNISKNVKEDNVPNLSEILNKK